MTKYVYLAGPIEQTTKLESGDWRQKAYLSLEYDDYGTSSGIKTINPLRADYDDQPHNQISHKNMLDVKKCDLLLANMPKVINDRRPSYGTTMEIAWFAMQLKPIVLVTDDIYLMNHPLIRTYVGWIYSDLDKATAVTKELLESY